MRTGGHLAATAALTIFSCGNAASQELDRRPVLNPECLGSIQKAVAHVAVGELTDAREGLAAALSRVGNRAGDPCAGLILHNLATIASMSGRLADAEHLAARSVAALETATRKQCRQMALLPCGDNRRPDSKMVIGHCAETAARASVDLIHVQILSDYQFSRVSRADLFLNQFWRSVECVHTSLGW